MKLSETICVGDLLVMVPPNYQTPWRVDLVRPSFDRYAVVLTTDIGDGHRAKHRETIEGIDRWWQRPGPATPLVPTPHPWPLRRDDPEGQGES